MHSGTLVAYARSHGHCAHTFSNDSHRNSLSRCIPGCRGSSPSMTYTFSQLYSCSSTPHAAATLPQALKSLISLMCMCPICIFTGGVLPHSDPSRNTAAYVPYHTPRYCIITAILPASVSIRVFLTLHRKITAMCLQYTLNHVSILLYSCCLTVAGSIYSHCTAIPSQRLRLGTYSSAREASRHLLAVPPSSILNICIYSGCESCSQSTGTLVSRGCYR